MSSHGSASDEKVAVQVTDTIEKAPASPGEHHDSSVAVPAAHGGDHADVKGKKEKKVHNAELYAAIKEANINPRSKESFHLYFCILVAFCCACANGYDGSLMTSIIDMPEFQKVFHTGTTGVQVSVIFSLYTV